MTFSLLVGLKNNLAYSRHFYFWTRQLYPRIEIVFVSYGSTDGTHQWLASLQDPYLRCYYEENQATLADTYNKAIEVASSEYVIFAHNDMVLAPDFIEQLSLLSTSDHIISYTTIEPPIFADDQRAGKIVQDFGSDLSTFQYTTFAQFAAQQQSQNKLEGKLVADSDRLSFFLSGRKQALLAVNGLDPLFDPMFCEDDDLLLRLKLKGFKRLVSLNAICYHFVSKTSRFSVEYALKTRQIELQSNRNFIRKWGFSNSSVSQKKYDIGLILPQSDPALLEIVEPWFSTVYTDIDTQPYVQREQPTTRFNLQDKLRPLGYRKENDILVELIGQRINSSALTNLPFLHEAIHHHLGRHRFWLSKIYYQLVPSFRWKQYRIRIINPISHEYELVDQTQWKRQTTVPPAHTSLLRDNGLQ